LSFFFCLLSSAIPGDRITLPDFQLSARAVRSNQETGVPPLMLAWAQNQRQCRRVVMKATANETIPECRREG
jgi:hypothetical protein